MPGARIWWTVVTKFNPVRMELKPRMNTPNSARVVFVVVRME